MLDDDHGVPGLDEPVQHLEQHLHIGEVQAGRRLVEQIQSLAGRALAEFASQLDPLRLAAGERRTRLPELEVIQPHIVQRLQHLMNLGVMLEQFDRLLHIHVEDIGDALLLVLHLQRFVVEPLPLADRATDPDVGQEVHFELGGPVSLARFAPPISDVEAEPPRRVSAQLGLRELGIEVADLVEELHVGGRVRARGATDRRLVDVDRLVEMLQAGDLLELAGVAESLVDVAVENFPQDVVADRTLARPTDACDTDEGPQRDLDIDVLEVVVRGPGDLDSLVTDGSPLLRNFNAATA